MSRPTLFAGLLIAGLLLAACSGGSAPANDPAPEQPAGQDDGNNPPPPADEDSPEENFEDLPEEDLENLQAAEPFEPTPSPLLEQSYAANLISDRDYSEYEIITLLPPDGIPALTNPPMYNADRADREYDREEMIIGVEYNGDARAFPVDVLSRHEIVNDTIGGIHAAVTW